LDRRQNQRGRETRPPQKKNRKADTSPVERERKGGKTVGKNKSRKRESLAMRNTHLRTKNCP